MVWVWAGEPPFAPTPERTGRSAHQDCGLCNFEAAGW